MLWREQADWNVWRVIGVRHGPLVDHTVVVLERPHDRAFITNASPSDAQEIFLDLSWRVNEVAQTVGKAEGGAVVKCHEVRVRIEHHLSWVLGGRCEGVVFLQKYTLSQVDGLDSFLRWYSSKLISFAA
jgi:hypothetical protein